MTTIWFFGVNMLFFIVSVGAFLLLSLITPSIVAHTIAKIWGKLVVQSVLCPVTLIGRENLPKGPVIIAANHTSALDIPVLLGYLPKRIHFIYKESLGRIPIFGSVLRRLQYLAINRESGRKALATIKKAGETIRKKNRSVLIFPEGTRNIQGELQKFKKGMVSLAATTQVEILPVAMVGCNQAWGISGKWHIKRHPIKIIIGKPIAPPSDNSKASLEKVNDQVHNAVQTLINSQS